MGDTKADRYVNVRRAHGPSWSHDGSQLAFVADLSGLDQVWLLNLPATPDDTREPEQLTHFSSRVGLVACSPVDQRMMVASDDGGNEHDQLYLIESKGSEPIALTNSPDVIHFFGAWSPDGSRICYSCNQRHPAFFDIWIMDIAFALLLMGRCMWQQTTEESSWHRLFSTLLAVLRAMYRFASWLKQGGMWKLLHFLRMVSCLHGP